MKRTSINMKLITIKNSLCISWDNKYDALKFIFRTLELILLIDLTNSVFNCKEKNRVNHILHHFWYTVDYSRLVMELMANLGRSYKVLKYISLSGIKGGNIVLVMNPGSSELILNLRTKIVPNLDYYN